MLVLLRLLLFSCNNVVNNIEDTLSPTFYSNPKLLEQLSTEVWCIARSNKIEIRTLALVQPYL